MDRIELRVVDQDSLDREIALHQDWLKDHSGEGQRLELVLADLRGLDFHQANLTRAHFVNCDLRGADLSGTNLSNARLSRSDCKDVNFRNAVVKGIDLMNTGTTESFRDADFALIKADLFDVFQSAPHEVPGLLQALRDGKISGLVYRGDCACLIGTIANIRGVDYKELPGITPDIDRPAERWFMSINKGDTPKNSVFASLTAEWLDEWLEQFPAPHSAATI